MSGFKAGFVSIIGRPNVGKSTLMNQLVGEKISIITAKAQTTRHRIMGMLTGENYQIVYSDTPGIIEPKYALQVSMMDFVRSALEDADLILLVTDVVENFEQDDLLRRLEDLRIPILVVINKIDKIEKQEVILKMEEWKKKVKAKEVIPVSALENNNVSTVLEIILENLPVHPPYFPEDELTDKTSRFLAAEMIREKIFLNYQKEIPYASEVIIQSFKEEADIIRVSALILVERKSQKGILIGKGGSMLKKVGTEARLDMEAFFGKKIFLEQHVKVDEDWRKNKFKLRQLGYIQS